MKHANKLMTLIAASALMLGVSISFSASAAKSDEHTSRAESEKDRADADKKLAEAQRRLEQAARDVAELSMSRSKDTLQRLKFRLNRGVLGAVIDKTEKDSKGVPIVSVSPGAAAEAAGLRGGDVMTSINGKSLAGEEGGRKLVEELGNAKPGDKVVINYEREGKLAKVDVEIKEPTNKAFAFNFSMPEGGVAPFMNGAQFDMRSFTLHREGSFGSAELAPISPKLGQYFGTDKGLLVVRAPHDSRLMLEDGDVIVDIDGRVPNNPGHAMRILGSYQAGEKTKITVMRMKKRQTLEVTIPKEAPGLHQSSFVMPFMPQVDGLPVMPEMPAASVAPDIT